MVSRAELTRNLPHERRDYLTVHHVPDLHPEQMGLITEESIMVRYVEQFDPRGAIQVLTDNEGKEILTIDFGGGKATKIRWTVNRGILVPNLSSMDTIKKDGNGANYMPFFQEVAKEADSLKLDVAVSFGGPLEGTVPLSIPNAPDFMDALIRDFNGDFAELFPSLIVINNDAQAGIKAATIAVERDLIRSGKLKPEGSVIFPINGGGFGLALLVDNQLMATEVGHAPVIQALNPHNQTIPCGMLNRTYVCIERVAASGSGVESLWHKLTGTQLDGREISEKLQQGDAIAGRLYADSALLFAHGIIGTADVKNIMKDSTDTVIVFHGGGFRVPSLKERIIQIIGKQRGFEPPTLFTDDISINACAEGAAIAAFYNPT